jgi:hypothetical protein
VVAIEPAFLLAPKRGTAAIEPEPASSKGVDCCLPGRQNITGSADNPSTTQLQSKAPQRVAFAAGQQGDSEKGTGSGKTKRAVLLKTNAVDKSSMSG